MRSLRATTAAALFILTTATAQARADQVAGNGAMQTAAATQAAQTLEGTEQPRANGPTTGTSAQTAVSDDDQNSGDDAEAKRFISGYLDVTATYPLRRPNFGTSVDGGDTSLAAELVRQSVITTVDVEMRLSSHWKALVRPSLYYNYLMDPLVGADYQASFGNFDVDALEAVALPLSTISRETERLASYQESVRLGYHLGRHIPYVQVGGSYSWFAHHVLSDEEEAQVEGEEAALAVDHDTFNIGMGDDLYVWNDQLLLASGIDFAHIGFRNAGGDASLWAVNVTLLSLTYTPGVYYLGTAVSIAKDARLIEWPYIPEVSFSIGAYF